MFILLLKLILSLEISSAIEIGKFSNDLKGEGEVGEYIEDDEAVDLILGATQRGLFTLEVRNGREILSVVVAKVYDRIQLSI